MLDDAKTAALIDEGLTPGEAEYFASGGRNAEGLTPPSESAAEVATPPAGSSERLEPVPSDLHRELRQRDEALAAERSATQQEREKAARLDERLRLFYEAVEQPVAPKQKPNRESDPFAYMAWLEEQSNATASQLEQVSSQFREREAEAELRTTYLQDARQFTTRQTDFGHAYNWLMANRDAELAAAGYTNKAERSRIIALDERDIVARALVARQQNPNAPGPAQIIYGLARARGFASQASAVPHAGGRGAPAPVPQGLDLSKLADMSDEDYMAWRVSLSPAQRKQLQAALGSAR
jgi:hypothetical protein